MSALNYSSAQHQQKQKQQKQQRKSNFFSIFICSITFIVGLIVLFNEFLINKHLMINPTEVHPNWKQSFDGGKLSRKDEKLLFLEEEYEKVVGSEERDIEKDGDYDDDEESSDEEDSREESKKLGGHASKERKALLQIHKQKKEQNEIKREIKRESIKVMPHFIPIDSKIPDEPLPHKLKQHIIIPTDCTGVEHWQSFALFHSIFQSTFEGTVTRIVSGCRSIEVQTKLMHWHNTHVQQVMSKWYYIHFVPDSEELGDDKKADSYLNIPFGIFHYFQEHKATMKYDSVENKMENEDDIIIVLKPDMILLRAFDLEFFKAHNVMYSTGDKSDFPRRYNVNHGTAFAQQYHFPDDWLPFRNIVEDSSSMIYNMTESEASKYFRMGPPLIATVGDMYKITNKWRKYLPLIHAQNPKYESLLYSYVVASADLGFRHQIIASFTISNSIIRKNMPQGWTYLESIPLPDVCPVASNVHDKTYLHDHNIAQSYTTLPNVIHYTQQYNLQLYNFDSKRLPSTFFTCSSPLLSVPPMDIGTYTYFKKPKQRRSNIKTPKGLREAFVICAMISFLNEASLFYKNMNCQSDELRDSTVWSKTMMLRDEYWTRRNKYLPEIEDIPDIEDDDEDDQSESHSPGIEKKQDDENDQNESHSPEIEKKQDDENDQNESHSQEIEKEQDDEDDQNESHSQEIEKEQDDEDDQNESHSQEIEKEQDDEDDQNESHLQEIEKEQDDENDQNESHSLEMKKREDNKEEQLSSLYTQPKQHIIFSSDCTGYQHWQSFVLFHSLYQSQHKGTVTRIVSGCSTKKTKQLLSWHEKHVQQVMSSQFYIHFTPKYDEFLKEKKDKEYHYFNKPFGVLHWLKHTDRLVHDDDIVILLDPDMVLLRPFPYDLHNNVIFSNEDTSEYPRKFQVKHGTPFAQRYAFGDQWRNIDLKHVVGPDSPVHNISKKEAELHHPAGAPYIATAKDMYKIVERWSEVAPRVHDVYPNLFAEMFGYIIAAADLGYKHQLVDSFMISDTNASTEGWKDIDGIPSEEACSTSSHYKDEVYLKDLENKGLVMPNVLHFCQRYGLGEWVWAKMRFTSEFFTCASPLLKPPPSDVAVKYDYFDPPRKSEDDTDPDKRIKYRDEYKRKREAFSMCTMIQAMNEASLFYKQNSCSGVEGTTFDKSMELKNIFWTENNRAFVPEDEGGSLMELPPSLAKKSVINEDFDINEDKVGDETTIKYYNNIKEKSNEKKDKYHIVFSTDCSGYQHWQSFVLFHSIYKSKYTGTVTRICSGCSKEQEEKTLSWHKMHVEEGMSSSFQIHFAPDYEEFLPAGESRGHYPYFNKPFGLLDWMQHGKTIKYVRELDSIENEEDIILLLDPDMILLRSFENDFSNLTTTLFSNEDDNPNYPRKFRVEHGSPFAQIYGIGTNWMKFNLTYIAGADSAAKNITKNEAHKYYQIGAPYMATARDMYSIAKKWSEFVPRVHDEHPHLLAEMFGYVIAAADLGLKHQVLTSFMVSNPSSDKEGWEFIDKIPLDESCSLGSHLGDEEFLIKNNLKKYVLPNVLHFCQRVGIGSWIWAKMRFPSDFFTCSNPLLSTPPMDIATKFDYFDVPKKSSHDIEVQPSIFYKRKELRGRNTFTLCAMIHAMNEASLFYKQNFCHGVQGTRLDKSMELKDVFWKDKENRGFVPEIELNQKESKVVGVTSKPERSIAPVTNEHPVTATVKANIEKVESNYHIVFSTDCSGYQHWQSYVLFYSIYKKSNFVGTTVNRIASGCTKEQEERNLAWHIKHVKESMSSRFHIHFAPDYTFWLKDNPNHSRGFYPYFNKPFGLLHWMQNGKAMNYDLELDKMQNEDDIVILLDPDMVLLKSFENDFSNLNTVLFSNEDNNPDYPRRFRVEHGSPFAQKYGVGNKWRGFNLTYIAGTTSAAKEITEDEADKYYQIGAPYLATGRDMYNIAKKWSAYVPRVHDEHPHLLAEMFAYIIASADLGLKHQLVGSFMISNPAVHEETWSFLDITPLDEACTVGYKFNSLQGSKERLIPNVLHFCQKYGLGEWLWSKGRFPSNFFTCDSPLLADPPMDIAKKYDYFNPPKQKVIEFVPGTFLNFTSTKGHARRKQEAFSLCLMISYMNDASMFYKKQFCSNNDGVRWDKSIELKDVLFKGNTYDYRPEILED